MLIPSRLEEFIKAGWDSGDKWNQDKTVRALLDTNGQLQSEEGTGTATDYQLKGAVQQLESRLFAAHLLIAGRAIAKGDITAATGALEKARQLVLSCTEEKHNARAHALECVMLIEHQLTKTAQAPVQG